MVVVGWWPTVSHYDCEHVQGTKPILRPVTPSVLVCLARPSVDRLAGVNGRII